MNGILRLSRKTFFRFCIATRRSSKTSSIRFQPDQDWECSLQMSFAFRSGVESVFRDNRFQSEDDSLK